MIDPHVLRIALLGWVQKHTITRRVAWDGVATALVSDNEAVEELLEAIMSSGPH